MQERSNANQGIAAEYVYSYARKSNEDRRALKSIEDQHATNAETAAEWNLPLRSENMLAEKIGHGGDEYWEGGGNTGLPGDDYKGRTRPVLTQLVRGVATGQVKVIIVWSLCRLWRDVGICEHLIQLFARHGCSLYDRNGLVDISTPEGRQAVRANAIAAQNMREMSAANSPRGTRRSRAKGKAVTNCNRLGFRSISGTGNVRHIPEEQELARQIYLKYDGGMNMSQIAGELTDQGYQWLPDVPKSRTREDGSLNVIYPQTIKAVLSDPRYQGRIPHEGSEWPCPALLIEGQPVIGEAIWIRVQQKLEQCATGAPSHRQSHPLSGLVKCGICGQSMRRSQFTHVTAQGTTIHSANWESMKTNPNNWCTHVLPPVQSDDLDEYITRVLMPLLLSEIRERASESQELTLRNNKAVSEQKLADAQSRMHNLAALWARGEMALTEYQDARRALTSYESDLKSEIACFDRKLSESINFERAIDDFGSATEGLRRDALRSVILWIAVIPSGKPNVNEKVIGSGKHKMRRNVDAGRVVICTAWDTLHTVSLERRRCAVEEGAKERRRNFLRDATPEEVIATVASFPDPVTFLEGIHRGRNGILGSNTFACMVNNLHEVTIAEFDIEEVEFK